MQISSTQRAVLLMAAFFAGTASSAQAGAPFVTDDADTTDKGHYEINLGSLYTHRNGETGGVLFGAEVNYGITEHLELHAYLPLAFDSATGSATRVGLGDQEFGLKYRLLDADDWGGWRPSIAIAPTVVLPVGDASRNLGGGRAHVFLPVWLSKEWGKWNTFGGAGYTINPGRGNRNWVFAGAGVTYEIDPKWTLGTELYYASAAVRGEKGGTALNVGGTYNINDTYHLLFSAGRNLTNANEVNVFTGFLGMQLTF